MGDPQASYDEARALAEVADEIHDVQTRNEAFAEIAMLYQTAAGQGHTGAQMSLAMLYANGEGVDTSLAHAVEWMARAAEHGDERAAHMLKLYRERLSQEEPGQPEAVRRHIHGDGDL
jgi:TPR repeat protein